MCVIETTPVLATRRLTLRAPGPEDAPTIARLAADPAIARNTTRMPSPYGLEDATAFVTAVAAQDPKAGYTFLLDHDDHGPVGVIGAFYSNDPLPEIGYWIGQPYWGRGLATEAVDGLVQWASRRWGKRALLSGHFTDNPASGRVLEKAGFLPTGEVRRQFSRARGEPVATRMMIWMA